MVRVLRSPSRWRLHTYFALLLLLFAATAVIAVVLVGTRARGDAIEAARADAEFAAIRASEELDASLLELQAVVNATAANPALAGLVENPAGCTLSVAAIGPLTAALYILGPNGDVACSSDPAPHASFGGAEWLADALAAPVISGPVSHPATGEPVLVVASPVAGEAIFAAVVQLVPIAVALSEQYGGPHGLEIVVVDRAAATVMSRSIEPDEWAAAPMAGTEFAAALGDGDRSDLDGVRRIYEVGVLESLGWEVHVGADRAAALAEADALFDTVVLAVGIGLAGALLASLGIYLIIVRPIRRLQRAITSASETMESPAPVAPSGPEEVADLARQFNRMTDSVQSEFARRKAAEAERDRLQHQLSRIERLESLGQLAGGMAHDFNNMLGVMLNYAVFVKEEVEAAALADETRWTPVLQDLTAIEDAVARSASLTRQLLAFARCDVAEPSGIQINETIETLAEMLTRTLGEHVRLQLNVGESPWTVRIDPRKLEQILVNLAANARDAMPEGGTLAIDSSNVDVDDDFAASRPGLVAGRYVRLRVSDTGSGMDPAVIEHAFEPLFTTKSVGRGTGLGLSTVYGIVTQAGGHISIYSEVGQGTTFSILLPAIEAAEPVPAPIAAPVAARAAGGSETVLVVEDDRTLLEVADRILSREGYRTLTAADGRSALQLARRHPGAIQLLLTDMVLPDMSGRELAEVLQGETPGIKVLYASGYAAPILAARATPVSAGSILEKPFPASDLLSKVRAALG